MSNEYHQQADAFLSRFGIKFRATLSNTKTPQWSDAHSGNHYRVTLSKSSKGKPGLAARLVFDFWGSINDAQKGEHPHAYDVLTCISGDANTPETFADFCAELGYESDSIKALQTFRRCAAFAKRLRAFFTSAELEALQEIQ